MFRKFLAVIVIAGLGACGGGEQVAKVFVPADNRVSISQLGDRMCIKSNGLPNHPTGTFPNAGNPNSLREQDFMVCVPATPARNDQPRDVRGSIGIALNGILIRPGTADWFDATSPRGHSRDRSSGWNLEGIGAAETLGIDESNGHVDPEGVYHYHGMPDGLVSTLLTSQIGFAADGFELHRAPAAATPSWQLKQGVRPDGPGGVYDGTYIQDYVFVPGSGLLDRCNGGMLNGKYVYFVTEQYPFFPRCLWGQISPDFLRR